MKEVEKNKFSIYLEWYRNAKAYLGSNKSIRFNEFEYYYKNYIFLYIKEVNLDAIIESSYYKTRYLIIIQLSIFEFMLKKNISKNENYYELLFLNNFEQPSSAECFLKNFLPPIIYKYTYKAFYVEEMLNKFLNWFNDCLDYMEKSKSNNIDDLVNCFICLESLNYFSIEDNSGIIKFFIILCNINDSIIRDRLFENLNNSIISLGKYVKDLYKYYL